MLSDVTVPTWMIWLAGGLVAAALTGVLLTWFRNRSPHPVQNPPLTIQPLSGTRTVAAPGKSHSSGKAFMPPPAPIASPPTDPKAENRATFRRAGNAVLIQVADADAQRKPMSAWVVDRSRQGLRLAVEYALPLGGMYSVRPVQAPPATPWCAVEVRHCAAADGHWEIGCRFLQPPPMRVLMLFG